MELEKQRGETPDRKFNLILASASPRRKYLLQQLGLSFRVVPSGIDEIVPAGLSAREAAVGFALAKARDVAARVAGHVVVGADTLIALDEGIFGKPEDDGQARTILEKLHARTHSVITGLAVVRLSDHAQTTGYVETLVRMRDYSWSEIEEYIASGEPLDKAGAYAIQGRGGNLVEGIEGCYNNVVGLPLCLLGELLIDLGGRLPVPNPICRLPSGDPCPATIERS